MFHHFFYARPQSNGTTDVGPHDAQTDDAQTDDAQTHNAGPIEQTEQTAAAGMASLTNEADWDLILIPVFFSGPQLSSAIKASRWLPWKVRAYALRSPSHPHPTPPHPSL